MQVFDCDCDCVCVGIVESDDLCWYRARIAFIYLFNLFFLRRMIFFSSEFVCLHLPLVANRNISASIVKYFPLCEYKSRNIVHINAYLTNSLKNTLFFYFFFVTIAIASQLKFSAYIFFLRHRRLFLLFHLLFHHRFGLSLRARFFLSFSLVSIIVKYFQYECGERSAQLFFFHF